jgi:hypothetical protein
MGSDHTAGEFGRVIYMVIKLSKKIHRREPKGVSHKAIGLQPFCL